MGKDFTFRASSEEERMLSTLYEWGAYTPSQAVNAAIEATPDRYLERKPSLMHVQLSDSAVKKLNKAAKKHKLSKATLIERAIDAHYKTTIAKKMREIAAKVDEIMERKETPFHKDIQRDMMGLLATLLPISLHVTGNVHGPFWVVRDNPITYLALQSD